MKKCTLIFLMLLFSAATFAQSVGINSDGSIPDPSAMLEVKSSNKGFLPPRINLTGTTDVSTISSPVAGLLIYNTSNTNDVTPGYYYYGGSSWVKVDAGLWSFDLEEDISTSYNVGIGTAAPLTKLSIESGALSVKSGVGNAAARPAVGTSRIAGEIAGIGGGLGSDDGFIRLSAGGGTATTQKSFIDLSGYSTVPDMNSNIVFGTAGTERMRINNDGNVGIGTTTPNEKLEVNGNIGLPTTGHISKVFGEGTEEFIIKGNNTSGFDPFISYTRSTVSGDRGFKFGIWDNNGIRNDWFTIWNGYVGIGTTTPSYTLYVNGTSGGTNGWNSSSDARLKKDVSGYENGLDKVMQLRPVTFNWKQEDYPDMNLDDRNHVGFIAQEVELVVPQVVSSAGDEMQTKSIAYSDLVPVLTKAIQEQQAEIEALKAQNANLKAENSSIKSDVEALKSVVFGTTQLKQQ